MRIAIGCPVANRAWILPEWLAAVEAMKIDAQIDIIAVVTPSTDNTEDLLLNAGALIIHSALPTRSSTDNDNHHWGQPQVFQMMADLRNELLTYVKTNNYDFFFSIDSDIIAPPNTLDHLVKRLHQIDGGAVSPKVPLSYVNDYTWNTMTLTSATRFDRFPPPTNFIRVDAIMAAVLLDRWAINNLKWGFHPQGEDLGFCLLAKQLNIPLWFEPNIVCEHRMEKLNDTYR